MSTKTVTKSKSKNIKKEGSKSSNIKVEVGDSDIEEEENMGGNQPAPLTGKFRSPKANDQGHLALFLEIVDNQAKELGIQGMDIKEALDTFISPITDDSYDVLVAHLKKCKKSQRKKKDKFIAKGEDGKPLKNPPSAYHLFCSDERNSIKANNPGVSNTEILTILGQNWTSLKNSKKQSDKKRYQKYINKNIKLKAERVKLIESLRETAIENGDFEEPKPKRPLSAYFIFIHSDAMKNEIEENNIVRAEASKYKSTKWASLSDEDKSEYFEQAEVAKKKYDKEVIAWQKRCVNRKKKSEEDGESADAGEADNNSQRDDDSDEE